MANLILGEGWEERVRNALGVKEAYLPDSAINRPEIIKIAEANITKRVPNYAALTGTDKVYLEAATVYECATLLCDEMPTRMPTQQVSPHLESRIDVKWDKKKKQLEDKRDTYLANLVAPAIVSYFKTT